jgi:hypothetical protein
VLAPARTAPPPFEADVGDLEALEEGQRVYRSGQLQHRTLRGDASAAQIAVALGAPHHPIR